MKQEILIFRPLIGSWPSLRVSVTVMERSSSDCLVIEEAREIDRKWTKIVTSVWSCSTFCFFDLDRFSVLISDLGDWITFFFFLWTKRNPSMFISWNWFLVPGAMILKFLRFLILLDFKCIELILLLKNLLADLELVRRFVVWRENYNNWTEVGNGSENFAREFLRVWRSVIWQKNSNLITNVRLPRLRDLLCKCCVWRNVYKLENIRIFLKYYNFLQSMISFVQRSSRSIPIITSDKD